MTDGDNLYVRVNDDLVLDAGSYEILQMPHGLERVIHAPTTTMFHQLLDYLKTKPDSSKRPACNAASSEGEAATALVLRWGSYLSVLLDHDKPLWSEATSEETSRISNEEMARINIEASAALAEWIDLYRQERGSGLYAQLVKRALTYLPKPVATANLRPDGFAGLADPINASQLIEKAEARILKVLGYVENYPSRIFANALVNMAWRYSPVERIHSGVPRGSPLDQRRVTLEEETEIMGYVACRLETGMATCKQLITEQPPRSWVEQIIPYALDRRICPIQWSLTETSREVRLPEPEVKGSDG
ncbi:MAG TPA: hypothetical protein PKW95_16060 [bacterium]|nr:hypothetical protein [bacterium]